jgi:hypothetical protein
MEPVVPGFSNALRTWNRRFFDFSILKKKPELEVIFKNQTPKLPT